MVLHQHQIKKISKVYDIRLQIYRDYTILRKDLRISSNKNKSIFYLGLVVKDSTRRKDIF